ncbi:hypothetical protein A2U01_0003342 [Trifolium medium]|uniref:Uncharacterized protein n=1 Tax=Trifolium medium TaxID=97028 RepID=A0A392M8L6_9FABA|nr:hypothetical protein [Trifolium medium]
MVIYESSEDDVLDSELDLSVPPPTSMQPSEEQFILPSPTNSVFDFISFSPNHDFFNELMNDFHPPSPIPSENQNPIPENTQKDLNEDLQLNEELQFDPDTLSNTISSFQNFINNNPFEQEILPSMTTSTEPSSSSLYLTKLQQLTTTFCSNMTELLSKHGSSSNSLEKYAKWDM